MERLATVAFYLGLISYTIAGTLFFVDLARREGLAGARRWAPKILGVGAAMHATHVVAASLLSRICPVESLHFALSLASLVATVVFLALRRRRRLDAVGAFVAPLSVLFLVGAQFVGTPAVQPDNVSRTLLALHVTANLLGFGLFLLAGGAGAFYLVSERRLKQKRSGGKSRLPPLDALDLTEHRLLLAGFPLLTFGAISGAVFVAQLGAIEEGTLLRAALSYVTWTLLAVMLTLRVVAGWSGRRAAYGALAGAACLLLVILLYALRSGVST
ncbi:MAG TPA: cytochrome c biogenesis protein CcsA [Polyangiaceae bacterium]|jgi:ABC-type uncharacterized transport system permease subunit